MIVVNAYRLRYIASFGAYAPPNSKLYFRAVGEPWFEDMAGFSPKVNILSLAAYERACSRCDSVTLEGKQHSVVFLYSRAVSLRALRGECEPNSRAGKMRTNISNEPSANIAKMREVGSRPHRLRQNKKDR